MNYTRRFDRHSDLDLGRVGRAMLNYEAYIARVHDEDGWPEKEPIAQITATLQTATDRERTVILTFLIRVAVENYGIPAEEAAKAVVEFGGANGEAALRRAVRGLRRRHHARTLLDVIRRARGEEPHALNK